MMGYGWWMMDDYTDFDQYIGALDPLHPNMVAVALDATIKGYDFRSPKEAYSIDKAHTEGINSNLQS